MQSLLTSILMGLLRYVLAGVTGWMITNSIATEEQTMQLIAGLAGAIVLVVSLVWVKYRDRVLVLTALKLPARSTPTDLVDEVAHGRPETPKMLGVLLAIAVASSLSIGCASVPRVQPLPEHVEMADQHVRTVTGNLQQLLTLAARVVDDVSQIEDAAARSGAIPPAVDAQFDAAMRAYVAASQRASDALVSGALTTWPELKSLVEPVLTRGQALIDVAFDIGAIRTRVQAFLFQLRDLLSAAAGEFLMGRG